MVKDEIVKTVREWCYRNGVIFDVTDSIYNFDFSIRFLDPHLPNNIAVKTFVMGANLSKEVLNHMLGDVFDELADRSPYYITIRG